MAKRNQAPIQTEAFVTMDGQELNIDTLPKEQRDAVGTALRVTYLNAMLRGQAVFRVRKTPEDTAGNDVPKRDRDMDASVSDRKK